MKNVPALLFGLLALLTLSPLPEARIEEMNLKRMMQTADGAVFAEVVAREVFFAPETNGPGLYFTRLTLEGVTLEDGTAIRVDVVHLGGVLDEDYGAYVSEAPSADDTAIGTRVIAFYTWVDNLGGGVAGNALYGAQGGIFRAVEGPTGTVVLGRGAGFALAHNLSVDALTAAIQELAAAEQR